MVRALTDLGSKKVAAREIPDIDPAPRAGQFCGESKFGTRKGDIVVRLQDRRGLPIESKVSNSDLNSVKRLNNDAAVKAGNRTRDIGLRRIVPAAVSGGVYNLHNLLDAQDRGATLFRAHDLGPLKQS